MLKTLRRFIAWFRVPRGECCLGCPYFIDMCFATVGYCVLHATEIDATIKTCGIKTNKYEYAFECYKCGGNGQDLHDPYFNCTVCDGTGVIRFTGL
jgi:hypothetical protein